MHPEKIKEIHSLLLLFVIGIASALGFSGYQNYYFREENESLKTEITETKNIFESQKKELLENIDALKVILTASQSDRNTLEQDLLAEREAVDAIEAQVQAMTGTVGTLKKLSDTDKELLKKYSRVYFLNENYVPKYLFPILSLYVYEPEKEKYISAEVWPFLQKMMDDANATGADIRVISAYRSFGTQSALKSAYAFTYGSGANKFSADQGYSEHQLGTTIDLTTMKLGAGFTAFEKTTAYTWLLENAHRYGFVLSYPKQNSYYVFEPWHWRFVGKSLAQKLHDEKKNFYDLTQREIDEYLVSLFDQ